jgi:ABC-type sugar transport system ATPase subunit
MNVGIVMEQVSFSYGGRQILDHISLAVKPGETVGIVGVSGGGKSTLLKLVSGLYDVQTGKILVMGAAESADRRKNVAMVMQSAALFPASIRDNITCGHDMTDAVIRRACEAQALEVIVVDDGSTTVPPKRPAPTVPTPSASRRAAQPRLATPAPASPAARSSSSSTPTACRSQAAWPPC